MIRMPQDSDKTPGGLPQAAAVQQMVSDGRMRFAEQRQQVAQVVGQQGEHLGEGTKDRKSKKIAAKKIQDSSIRETCNSLLDHLD